jgi:MFS family permease
LPTRSLSPNGAAAGAVAAGRDRLLVPVLGLCLLVGTAAYLMVFTMLSQITAALSVPATMVGWIVIATIITGTLSAALFPALGSVIGQRRLMLAAMGCLAIGSVVSAVAPDGATLLVGRVIAAPGFAASSLSIAAVRQYRSGPGLARSFGVLSGFAGVAAAVGFTLGGAVEDAGRGDWRSVFVAIAVISAITAILAAATMPGGTRLSRRVDVPGALLLAGGLVAALLPITEGSAWGWTSWRVTVLLAAAAVLLAAWAITALRLGDPLIRLNIIAIPGVAAGTVLFLTTGATVAIINLTVPSFLEAPVTAGYGASASVLGAGLYLLPFALAITVAGLAAGRLARRVPARLIAVAALGCEALALGLLAGFHQGTAMVVILIAVFGIGHGAALSAEYVILTGTVPAEAAGAAVGVATAVDGISGSAATAVTTALLASGLVRAGAVLLPSAGDYAHAWLFGAAVAAAGAIAVAAGAYTERTRTRGQSARDAPARARSGRA